MSKVHFGLGLVLGAVLGAGATYFLTRDDLDREMSEQNENIRKYYKEKYEKELEEATDKLSELSEKVSLVEENDLLDKYDKVLLNYDYSSIASSSSQSKEDTNVVKEEAAKKPSAEPSSVKKDDTPYQITQYEFENENKNYYKEEYTYYPADELLVDRRDKPVETDSIGGPAMLRKLHKKENSELYIRNDRLEIDFYIVVDREDYM